MLTSTSQLFVASILVLIITSNTLAIAVSNRGESPRHKAARTSGIIGLTSLALSLALIAIAWFDAFMLIGVTRPGDEGWALAVSAGLLIIMGLSLAISIGVSVVSSIASVVTSLLAMCRS